METGKYGAAPQYLVMDNYIINMSHVIYIEKRANMTLYVKYINGDKNITLPEDKFNEIWRNLQSVFLNGAR